MKHLKKYDPFVNESIFGDISRLNPERKKNDEKAEELIDEIRISKKIIKT